MDELARALDLDPVELRRRTLIEEGAEGPTRQVFEKLGMKETLERAVELIGYGQELPEDEAIGVACGWWPCFGVASGAYVKLNGDGTGTIITGAQENGTGAVMALPLLVAERARDEARGLLAHVPGHRRRAHGTWARAARRRRSTTAARSSRPRRTCASSCSTRPRSSSRPTRDDLELAEGDVRVKGAPDKSVTIADLAGSGAPFLGKGSGDVPDAPPSTPRAASAGSGWSRSSHRS